MSIIEALVLGVLQGFSEFLPISSSGHLVVVPIIFGWQPHSLVFDTILHLGTAAALLVYFFKDLTRSFVSLGKESLSSKFNFKKFSPDALMGIYVLVACIPAGIVGFLFDDIFESKFRSLSSVAFFMFMGTVLLYLANKKVQETAVTSNSKDVTTLRAFLIGLFQILALFPGISRSGSTISGGVLLGLSKEHAAKFSFMLSVPIVVLAAFYSIIKSFELVVANMSWALLIGFGSSFLVGISCIHLLLRYLKKSDLTVFIVYRFFFALLLMFLSLK